MVDGSTAAGEEKQGEGGEGAAEPGVKTPEVEIPEVKTPEVETPGPKTPEVETPDVKSSAVKVPDVTASDAKAGPAFPPVKRPRRIIDMRRPRPVDADGEKAPPVLVEAPRPATEAAKPAAEAKAPEAAPSVRAEIPRQDRSRWQDRVGQGRREPRRQDSGSRDRRPRFDEEPARLSEEQAPAAPVVVARQAPRAAPPPAAVTPPAAAVKPAAEPYAPLPKTAAAFPRKKKPALTAKEALKQKAQDRAAKQAAARAARGAEPAGEVELETIGRGAAQEAPDSDAGAPRPTRTGSVKSAKSRGVAAAKRRAEVEEEEKQPEAPPLKPGFFQRILNVFRKPAKKSAQD